MAQFATIGLLAVAGAAGGFALYRGLDQNAVAQTNEAPAAVRPQPPAPAVKIRARASIPPAGSGASPFGAIGAAAELRSPAPAPAAAPAAPAHAPAAPAPAPAAKAAGAALSPQMQAIVFSDKPSSLPPPGVMPDKPPAPAKVAPAPPPPAAEPAIPAAMQQDMLTHAEAMIHQGDIAGARIVLEHLDRAGNRQASFLLGQTFDQAVLTRWNVRGGIRGDQEKAAVYYRRAAAAGIAPARDSLAALTAAH